MSLASDPFPIFAVRDFSCVRIGWLASLSSLALPDCLGLLTGIAISLTFCSFLFGQRGQCCGAGVTDGSIHAFMSSLKGRDRRWRPDFSQRFCCQRTDRLLVFP